MDDRHIHIGHDHKATLLFKAVKCAINLHGLSSRSHSPNFITSSTPSNRIQIPMTPSGLFGEKK